MSAKHNEHDARQPRGVIGNRIPNHVCFQYLICMEQDHDTDRSETCDNHYSK